MKKRIEGVTVYGIDIGKNTFHVVGLDSSATRCCTASSGVIDCSFTLRTRLQRLLAWRAAQDHSGWLASCKHPDTQLRSFLLSS